jgi:site-specific DNA-methyltransferase (adenine-specific)
MENVKLMLGDCLELMQQTRNEWDKLIDLDALWRQYLRVIKKNGAIVLFADGMFLADLMHSNRKMWRYNLVWDKQLTTGFLNANRQPLRRHESIVVFYQKQPTYNPQKVKGKKIHSKKATGKANETDKCYGRYKIVDNSEKLGDMKHPTSIVTYAKPHPSVAVHPTQKPVPLLEYLVKTYTNEGDTVLDNCMGSGSTGVACVNTGRQFIGIELDEGYFEIATNRITEAVLEIDPGVQITMDELSPLPTL